MRQANTRRVNMWKTNKRIVQGKLNMWKTNTRKFQLCNTKARIFQVTLKLWKKKTISNQGQKTKKKILSVTKIEYLFQEQSSISEHWFKLDTHWIEESFMTRDPGLFKNIDQKNIP